MPSIITHAAVPLALWCAADRGRIPPRLLAAGVIAAMLPDADVLAFALHIPYADAFGHRGASHSLLFAFVLAALAAVLAFFGSRRPWSAPRNSGSRRPWSALRCQPRLAPTEEAMARSGSGRPWSAVSCQPRLAPAKAGPTMASTLQAAVFVFVCAASHPLLDAMTSGGLGVALAWPWSEQRFFAPWRPIRVSPFAPQFFSARGLATVMSELRWVWLPLAGAVVAWKLIQPAPVAPRDPS
ncbi:metal-dependent hydrolase [Stenotrophomonas maltophilia]|jgi:inner membrane protein|uniref:metal-dependent hydrolase n=1 Tax=Stenotrophomonas TaxID=40323 RepID=UPI00066A3775|nr:MULTISPECIES: metal-dependent hydrolase [Stenotrophomonas]ELN2585121.1 metal-dependent hydrolase [Stenotrophomonas maltophilia]ELN2593533.1 metal-dependent hydrolase [Stenotrophomonas maltophilia]MBA0300183.1 metal-dependent hydrolase [Stenotrophomonas maltophilia]MBA0355056.1 metal-dependent hydrolase [Stenotrophomonas maltophilia]MBH1403537.1 metal-dependent hydrolase [Stenotrophomonas maltophilia]